jgi:hypothetical protein
MAKPTARKTAQTKKKKTAAKKPSRSRASTAAKPDRTVAKKKCQQCGASPGIAHDVDCPNGSCVECGGTLGHMLTCSHHPNYRPVLDGKTGAVLEATVDGKMAKIDTSPKPKKTRAKKAAAPDVDDDSGEEGEEEASGLKRLPPPKIDDAALFEALQYAIDRKIIFGIKQPLTRSASCDVEWFDDESQQSVGCAGSAAFDFEKLDTCGTCKHTSKHILEKKCLPHMAMRISGELKDRQISMFEDGE